ncbi:MAG: DUF4326 domain-containing protein [Chromatiaceae bacterium]
MNITTKLASTPLWTTRQLYRRHKVESGLTVVANLPRGIDAALIEWATQADLAVNIDRKGPWGNPFETPADGDRDTVCDNYARLYLPNKPSLLCKISNLKGKVLVCWCHPKRCHGDHLAELANGREVADA